MRVPLAERGPLPGGQLIDEIVPDRLETALFALGGFEKAEARLGFTRGVWRTCVGYAGGVFPHPCHADAGDHIEVVRVEYDPESVSYGQLLELFMHWYCSSPLDPDPQHAAAVFVRTEKERRLAQAAVDRCYLCSQEYLKARILAFKSFHLAENACQKSHLRHVEWLYLELLKRCGSEEGLRRSTAAARLNGFLGQAPCSCWERFPESEELYGLTPQELAALKKLVCSC